MSETPLQKAIIFLLRIFIGWVFLYAGVRQVLSPAWTAMEFLGGAKTFPGFYALFTSPAVLPVVNFLVKWGHTLIGLSLVLGIGVRISSSFAAALTILYYLPRLDFPFVGSVSNYIVEYHLVYALVLVYLGSVHAGRCFGLENWFASLPPIARLIDREPRIRALLG